MKWFWNAVIAGACVAGAIGCANKAQQTAATAVPAAAQPLPAETNPPGDIPDTQVFVTYASQSGHYAVLYPEGWPRTEQGGGATFTQAFDGERIRVVRWKGAPRAAIAPFDVVRDVRTSSVHLPSGTALLVSFTSNSMPNGVTGKRVRLENNTYIFSSPKGSAFLDLWAPLGSDNIDQWRRISRSFQWK